MDKSLNKTADSAHIGKYAGRIKPSPRAEKAIGPKHALHMRFMSAISHFRAYDSNLSLRISSLSENVAHVMLQLQWCLYFTMTFCVCISLYVLLSP